MAFSLFGNGTPSSERPSFWNDLQSQEDLDRLIEDSFDRPQLIFKHSTRCGISRVVLRQFESEWGQEKGNLNFLDLIKFRSISNEIEHLTGVVHQSPQVIVIHKGQAIADSSHQSISAEFFRTEMNR